ncbi:hypothetical protein [Gemmata sp.]|uniref:hypothetical protein n=1 Tax=Gemmata sp. TaxID=1914242 RepID=UPI003F72FD51
MSRSSTAGGCETLPAAPWDTPAGGLGSVTARCPTCECRVDVPVGGAALACPRCGDDMVVPVLSADPFPGVAHGIPLAEAPPLPTEKGPAPAAVRGEDAAAHLAWLQAEIGRFDAHVTRQLAACVARRRDAEAAAARAESDLYVREMAVARRTAAADARDAALAAREADLDLQTAAFRELQTEVATQVDTAVELQRQRTALTRGVARLEDRRQHLRSEVAQLEAVVAQHAAAAAGLAARAAALDRRADALERGERDLAARGLEVDELEERLRRELEAAAGRPPCPGPGRAAGRPA